VLTTIHPSKQRAGGVTLWALTSGIAGLLANVLLVLFFLLARPFNDVQNSFGWLGTANDWVIVVQFLTMIPVALALRRWLPHTSSVRVATAIAVGAMLAVAALQLLLIAGALDFDLQVLLAVAAFFPVYVWVFIASSLGHRRGILPRSVTRFGLLLGASFPVALLIMAAGYLIGSKLGYPLAFAVPGLVFGALGWLALPVWPLVLARWVFGKPVSLESEEKGLR
jgi:hypothetical protein